MTLLLALASGAQALAAPQGGPWSFLAPRGWTFDFYPVTVADHEPALRVELTQQVGGGAVQVE